VRIASRAAAAGLVLAAAGLAALWPLTAMAVSPLLMPSLLVVAVTVAALLARPEYGIATVLALAPFTDAVAPVTSEPGSAFAQPLQVLLPALVLTVAFAAAVSERAERPAVPTIFATAPIAFLAVTLMSAVQAMRPSDSVNSVVILCAAVVLFYATLQVGRSGRRMEVVVAGALVGLLGAGLQGTLQHLLGMGGPYGVLIGGREVLRVQGSFDHPNGYAVYLITLLPLAGAVALGREIPRPLRSMAAVAAGLAAIGVVVAYSRGAIIGLVVGTLAWLFVLRPGRMTLLAAVLGIALIVAAPASLRERFDPGAARQDAGLREALWRSAVDIAGREPVLGVGPNNFSAAYEVLANRRGDSEDRPLLDQGEGFILPSSAHNLYLNTLAEQGLIGLLGLGLLFVATGPMLYAGRRLRDPVGRALCVGLGAGLSAWAVRGIFDAGLGDVIVPGLALVAAAAVYVSRE
jgi:hypothetical protein